MDERAFRRKRERMVRNQLESRGIVDERVLRAMLDVPRHRFVPPSYRNMAYADAPLPIGHRQTISQPYIVALMTQLLHLKGDERVLEIGTGSGYQAAILSTLVKEVVSLERIPDLATSACNLLMELGYVNVQVLVGDGSAAAGVEGTFDGVIVTAAAPDLPDPIKDTVKDDGRVIIPVGRRYSQFLQRWTKSGGTWRYEEIAPVAFVPLLGKYGWENGAS